MTFQSVGDFVCKEQQLTMQLESEQFWSSLENFVGDSLCNWHDEQCSQFTNEFTDGIYVGKNGTSSFFFIFFNFFLTVIPSVYTEGIFLSVKSLGNLPTEIFPWKFTDGNIPSIFPFVFIDFLVVFYAWTDLANLKVKHSCFNMHSLS